MESRRPAVNCSTARSLDAVRLNVCERKQEEEFAKSAQMRIGFMFNASRGGRANKISYRPDEGLFMRKALKDFCCIYNNRCSYCRCN